MIVMKTMRKDLRLFVNKSGRDNCCDDSNRGQNAEEGISAHIAPDMGLPMDLSDAHSLPCVLCRI